MLLKEKQGKSKELIQKEEADSRLKEKVEGGKRNT